MKILKDDRKHGLVKLAVETADDLWYFYTLVDEGDVCTGQSEYKFKLGAADGKQKIVRKRVWISLAVEKKEFSRGQLRISGSVVDGAEEVPRGSHHGLDITEGTHVELRKERWMGYHREKLDDAVASGGLKTLLLLFDREQAVFALLKPSGPEILLQLKGDVQKKGFDEGKTGSFYKQLVEQLQEYASRHKLQRVVAASPAFWKEYLRKELSDDLTKRVIFATVSSADPSAIKELLSREEVKQALAGERAARETALVESLLERLSKDMLVYGLEDIRSAIAEGNLKTLCVSERKIAETRENGAFGELEEIMRKASDIGAAVHLLSTEEAMQRLDGLTGAAGVKRW